MKQKINTKLSALAIVASVLALSGAPALARAGNPESHGQVTSATANQSTEVEAQPETETNDVNHNSGLHNKGQELAAQLRQAHKAQSQATRQKKCESRKHGLSTKFDHIVTNSQRIQDRISGILDKALKYQQNNNLTIDNGLVTAAQDAKTKSAGSITALQAVKPSLDCNNASVADDVATFKTAAVTTRDNLKAYRSSVKAVLQALEAAKPAASGRE